MGDYFDTYGISTDGTELKLTYVLPSEYGGYGARTYLVDGTGADAEYKMFHLDLEKGWEFSFDVDLSRIPCAMNDALYFVEMEKDGGKSRGSQGPHFGTGYCDAQCPDDLHHVDGEANPPSADGWAKRQCCAEMDVWEANSISNALTPHTCELPNGDDMVGVFECTDDEMCGVSNRYTSVCDRDGCDFNAYRLGDQTFYGPGEEFTVNTLKPMTVTTRWIVENGELVEIGRIYYQEGKEIPQTMVEIEGSVFNTITDATCGKMRDYWANKQATYLDKGGMKSMGESMARGHVLVMSLWHDDYVQMKWLDAELGEDPGRTLPSTTTVPTTTTTTPATCGFVPTKCGKAIENNFNKINKKSFGKFEKITGVTQEEATLDDMTLYFYCKGKAASKCGDLQLPCTCSRPPCVCPGATTTTTATTSTTAPITTSTTTKATTTSTTTAASTTTTKSSQNCVLSACGYNLKGQAWCSDSNSWLSTAWCHATTSNCGACGGLWCATNRRLLQGY